MEIRFYIDPESDEPHVSRHGVPLKKRLMCSKIPVKTGLDDRALELRLARPEPDVICA
jgi:hypothetical protein